MNDVFGTTPTIAGVLDIGSATRTVDASGLSLNNLVISAQILGAGGGALTKTGAGALSLTSATSNFTGGVNLNVGSLIIGASDTLAAGLKTGGPLGLGTLSVASGLKLTGTGTTIYNPVTLATNNLIINGVSSNNLVLNGAITFGAALRRSRWRAPPSSAPSVQN